jgi:hypothetical protein
MQPSHRGDDSDPFGERSPLIAGDRFQLLGARFKFESNSRQLLQLIDSAYAGLPRHRLSGLSPRLTVRLLLGPGGRSTVASPFEPPPMSMLSAAGCVGGASASSTFVVLSPAQRSALVVASRQMLKFTYHARYELLEFAVFSLAARTQRLVPLHAACIGKSGRGILLIGSSGSGKSTVTLQCLLHGLEILSEDSVFIEPKTLLATGIANFLHVREDSLHWLESERDAAAVRRSPVIRRRSGVEKFEVDLRQDPYRLAGSALKIAAVVFLSRKSAAGRAFIEPLPKAAALARLVAAQPYAANQPEWAGFSNAVSRVDAFELRRGRHPREAVDVLEQLLLNGR